MAELTTVETVDYSQNSFASGDNSNAFGGNPFAGGDNSLTGGDNPFAGDEPPFPFNGATVPFEGGNLPTPFNVDNIAFTDADPGNANSNETIGNGNWNYGSDNATLGNGNWYFGNENATIGNGNWNFGNENATIGNGNWYLGSSNAILGDSNNVNGDDNIVIGNPISNGRNFTGTNNIVIGNEDWLLAINRDTYKGNINDLINGDLSNILNSGGSNEEILSSIRTVVDQSGQGFVELLSKPPQYGSTEIPTNAIAGSEGSQAVPEPISSVPLLMLGLAFVMWSRFKRIGKA